MQPRTISSPSGNRDRAPDTPRSSSPTFSAMVIYLRSLQQNSTFISMSNSRNPSPWTRWSPAEHISRYGKVGISAPFIRCTHDNKASGERAQGRRSLPFGEQARSRKRKYGRTRRTTERKINKTGWGGVDSQTDSTVNRAYTLIRDLVLAWHC